MWVYMVAAWHKITRAFERFTRPLVEAINIRFFEAIELTPEALEDESSWVGYTVCSKNLIRYFRARSPAHAAASFVSWLDDLSDFDFPEGWPTDNVKPVRLTVNDAPYEVWPITEHLALGGGDLGTLDAWPDIKTVTDVSFVAIESKDTEGVL